MATSKLDSDRSARSVIFFLEQERDSSLSPIRKPGILKQKKITLKEREKKKLSTNIGPERNGGELNF